MLKAERPQDLFPNADPSNPETRAKFRKWLANEKEDLAQYYRHKESGEIGRTAYYCRGFVSQTKQKIKALETWLVLAENQAEASKEVLHESKS